MLRSSGGLELEPIEPSSNNGATASEGAGPRERLRGATDSSGGTEVGVQQSNHRVPCRALCGTLCLTGPPEECFDLQKLFLAIYALAFLVFGAAAGWALGPFYPGLVLLPLVFVLLDLAAYLLCACTDPGVIPPQPDLDESRIGPSTRACRKCNLLLEERTRHCSFCNACVRELDHHCGVTGNCVGARNQVHFTFLFFYYLCAFWALATGVVYAIVCRALASSDDFDGSFPAGVEISALALQVLFAAIAVVSMIIYVLAYFGCLGAASPLIFRYCCCMPLGHSGVNMLESSLRREPLCCPWAPCARLFTVPVREFYPDVA